MGGVTTDSHPPDPDATPAWLRPTVPEPTTPTSVSPDASPPSPTDSELPNSVPAAPPEVTVPAAAAVPSVAEAAETVDASDNRAPDETPDGDDPAADTEAEAAEPTAVTATDATDEGDDATGGAFDGDGDDLDLLDDEDLLPAEPAPALWVSLRALPLMQHTVLLTLLGALIMTSFVLIQPTPRWLALLGALTVAAAMEGVLHATRRRAIATGIDTAPFLVLPTMYMLATPAFIAYSFHGYVVIAAALLGALGLGAIATAQIATIRDFDLAHEAGRLIASAATYFTVFALYSLTYTFDLEVRTAAVAAGLIAGLLAVELMRDGEIDPLETLVFSIVCGLVVGEARVVLYYLPVGGNLAALALLFVFYFVAGILHAHVTRHLDTIVALQYAAVAATGGALVIGARAAGLG